MQGARCKAGRHAGPHSLACMCCSCCARLVVTSGSLLGIVRKVATLTVGMGVGKCCTLDKLI